LPARAGRFGGFAPPVEAVERTPLLFDSGMPEISSPFGAETALPGAGTRCREPPAALVHGGRPDRSQRHRSWRRAAAGGVLAVVGTLSAISAFDFARRKTVSRPAGKRSTASAR
jgi:hypothetical protein